MGRLISIHEAYGFGLDQVLAKHPIKELNEPVTKDRLMQSLERGNLHQVTFTKGDKEEKMFIEANPQFKSVKLYDGNLKKVFQENEKKDVKADNGQELATPKASEKQSPTAEEPDEGITNPKKQPKRRLKV